MPKSSRKSYEIGYARPPKSGQFKKGQSGNKRGRPKGSKLFSETVVEALDEKVTISENGRRRIITKREALAKQLVNKAAGGDIKSIKLLSEMSEGVDERERDRRSEAAHQGYSSARERLMKKLDQMRERMDAGRALLAKDKK
jgi:hypothetical protein